VIELPPVPEGSAIRVETLREEGAVQLGWGRPKGPFFGELGEESCLRRVLLAFCTVDFIVLVLSLAAKLFVLVSAALGVAVALALGILVLVLFASGPEQSVILGPNRAEYSNAPRAPEKFDRRDVKLIALEGEGDAARIVVSLEGREIRLGSGLREADLRWLLEVLGRWRGGRAS
jgi:hypothetical protein